MIIKNIIFEKNLLLKSKQTLFFYIIFYWTSSLGKFQRLTELSVESQMTIGG